MVAVNIINTLLYCTWTQVVAVNIINTLLYCTLSQVEALNFYLYTPLFNTVYKEKGIAKQRIPQYSSVQYITVQGSAVHQSVEE